VQTAPLHETDNNTTAITSLSATFMTSSTVALTSAITAAQVTEHSVTGNKYELIFFKGKAADLLAFY